MGVVARDVDGSTTGTSGLASMTGTKFSIIPNHRMMMTNSDLQWVHPATSRAFVSSKKFAHLRIAYPGATSPSGPNAYLVPDVRYTRTGGGSGEFQPGSFTDTLKSFAHTQIPVIVRSASPFNHPVFTYQCDFLQALTNTGTTKLKVIMEDFDPGDTSPLIVLTGVGIPVSSVSVETLPFTTLAILKADALTVSGYYQDGANDKLYIRLVNPTNSNANSITVNVDWQ